MKLYFRSSLFLFFGLLLSGFFSKSSRLAAEPLPQSSELAPIVLEVGEQRILQIPHIVRYSVSGYEVRHVRLDADRILIKAIKIGKANLFVESQPKGTSPQSKTFSLHVVKNSQLFTQALVEQVSGLQQVEVIRAAGQFVLRGTLDESQAQEAKKVALIREKFPQTVLDEVEITESWKKRVQPEILNTLKPYPDVQFSWIEDQAWVVGSVSSLEIASSLSRKLKMIFPLIHTQIQTFTNKEPTVYLKIYLLEALKVQLNEWGVDWPSKIPGQIHFYSSKASLQTNPVEIAVNALEKNNQVKILSSPELVVKTPGKATLFAGGEMPIRQQTKFNQQVIWKNVGLSLKIETHGIAGPNLRLSIETSLSYFNDQFSNDDIPGIQNNEMQTSVEAQFGKPILLSGLVQDQLLNQKKGLPFLQKIPILGAFFSSESYLNHSSELVAVLVPFRKPPESALVRVRSDLPRGFLPLPREEFSLSEIKEAQKSSNYPWNLLE